MCPRSPLTALSWDGAGHLEGLHANQYVERQQGDTSHRKHREVTKAEEMQFLHCPHWTLSYSSRAGAHLLKKPRLPLRSCFCLLVEVELAKSTSSDRPSSALHGCGPQSRPSTGDPCLNPRTQCRTRTSTNQCETPTTTLPWVYPAHGPGQPLADALPPTHDDPQFPSPFSTFPSLPEH